MTGERIDIGCTDGAHEGKRAQIQSFVRAADGTWKDALASPGVDTSPSRTALVADEPVSEASVGYHQALFATLSGAQGARPPRGRYSLRCPLCGTDISVRAERLEPILDKFAEAGVPYVELSTMGRAVERYSALLRCVTMGKLGISFHNG